MAELLSGLANSVKNLTSNTEIRRFTDKLQSMTLNTPTEQLVWDTTNEDPWGPTGPQMKEISTLTYQYDQFHPVMTLLWKRMLEDNKTAWRRVYKSLVLLHYLLQNGSERVVSNSKDQIFRLRSLEHYNFKDDKGKDQGINIRVRAKNILELLQDDDKLRAERKKAKGDAKEKYQGYTSDDIKMGRGGSYNKNSSSDDSFKNYNKRKYSWEDEEPKNTSHKEVNSFQFPDEIRRDSASPELGFRDDTQAKNGEDDDFGDFASARSSTGNKTVSKNTHVPALPPPVVSASFVEKPASIAPSASIDLLGLGGDLNGTSPNAPTAAPAFDLFGGAPTAQSNISRPPRPPSGGSITAPASTQHALIDDLFGPSVTATVQQTTPNTEIFGSEWSMASATQPTASNAFSADFGSFAGSSNNTATSVNPMASSGLDFFASTPIQPLQSSMTPSASFPPAHGGPTLVQAAKPTLTTPSKMGSTWAGTSGLIDLDNLGTRKATTKQSLPMNQMQSKNNQPQAANNGGFPW